MKGDWAIRVPDLAPGGWAFEYENDLYPDIDDAAVISLALRQLGIGDDAVTRGLDWLVGMQSRSGGWGAFDVDNQAMWLYRIPFCDFGKVTDEPSADVTAHALETLGARGRATTTPSSAASRGCSPSRRTTAPGSGAGASTTSTAPARRCRRSRRAAFPLTIPPMRRAVAWLDSVQQENGGFGEDIRSYADPAWRGRAPFATPSQTAGRCSATWPQETLRMKAREEQPIIFAMSSAPTATGTKSTSPAPAFRSIS